jgi:hypothetical protein
VVSLFWRSKSAVDLGCMNRRIVLVLVRCVPSWDLASTYKGVVCLTRHSFTCNRDITTCTAYLSAPLEAEEIYVRPPPEAGMQAKVWHLQKALYGLKQAARAWYGRLHEALSKEGFRSAAQDPCLFVWGTGEAKTYMLIHVDDAAVCGTATHAQQGIDDLAKHFRLKDQGEMTVFIGQEVIRYESGILLRQARYARARTDMAFPVGVLSRHMAQPTHQHFHAVKRVLRFLRGTYDHGLFFASGATAKKQGVLLYADANLVGDSQKRRSTAGMVLTMYGTPVMWMSKLQSVTAMSTAEAEYMASAMAAKEGLWARQLLGELTGNVETLPLMCGNQSAIALVTERTAGVPGRSKHVDLHFHFLRDRYQRGDLSVRFVPTGQQRADVLTKALGGAAFVDAKKELRVHGPVEARSGA